MADSKTVKTLSLPPRIDDDAAIILKSTLIKLINNGARKILCNFSATNFISNAGAEELVNVARFLAKIDGEIGICWIKPEVQAAIQQPYLFKFYSIEESVALIVLKNLVTYFEMYEDIFDIKVYMKNTLIHVEIYLIFDGDQSMREVQQTVSLIRHSLERDIKDVQILIIPSTQIIEITAPHSAEQRKQIVFSSQAEVVRQLAKAVEQTIPEPIPCVTIREVSASDNFDLISVIFLINWTTADSETMLYLKELRNQKLALFAIVEDYPYSGYAGECMKNVAALLDASNTVVGKFVCQTKNNQLSETDLMRARNKYFDIIQQ